MNDFAGQPDLVQRSTGFERLAESLFHVIVVLLAIQLVSGLLLLTAYAPASTTAWGSVWHIQSEQYYGWLIRGLHVVATDALIVIAALYLAVILVRGPWQVSHRWHWWIGLGMLGFILAFALTGYLLPYDQRAYWGTIVRTNILAKTPYVGEMLKRLLLGDDAPGTMALTRMYALHVAYLPILFVLLRRFIGPRLRHYASNVTKELCGDSRPLASVATMPAPPPDSGDATMVPVVQRAGGCNPVALHRALLRLATILTLVCWVIFRHHHLGRNDLDAPADPTALDYPARPEWWALPLFQWLKYFATPAGETVAAIMVPGAMVGLLFLLALIPRKLSTPALHRWILRVAALFVTAGLVLAMQALWVDLRPGAAYHQVRARADRQAARVMALAQANGIPPEGAQALLLFDPLSRGPTLFAANCASCHRIHGQDGLGDVPAEAATSSDLGGFATGDWIRGLLTDPLQPHYFGLMKNPDGEPAHTKMLEWLAEQRESNADPSTREVFEKSLDDVADYLADEAVSPGRFAALDVTVMDENHADPRQRGRRVFMQSCNECHTYQEQRLGTFSAPEMFGYGSPEWIALMISSPDHELRYRSKGKERAQMPAFRDRLTANEIRLIAEWIFLIRDEPPTESNSSKTN